MPVTRLYDLLAVNDDGEAATLWPRSRIKSSIGFSIDTSPIQLVRYLQEALEFRAVRPGASAGRVGLSAEIVVKNPPAPIYPLVLTQMPDIAFYLQDTVPAGPPQPTPSGTPGSPARLFVTQGETGIELLIEGLPVEIRISDGLLGPLRSVEEETDHPGGGEPVTLTEKFQPGVFDSLEVTLRDTGESSIFVHLRVRMTEEMDFIIEPAVPISIGPCRFSGLPCQGVHDINFIPSPRLQGEHSEGEQALEWTRHALDRLEADAAYSGVITLRTIDFNGARTPFKELAKWMNADRSEETRVEFVLEDIALPLFSLINLPVPSHGMFGLRRKIEAGDDPEEAFALSESPVQVKLRVSDSSSIIGDWRLMIDELLLRIPASSSDQFIFLKMALLFGTDPGETHAATFDVTDEWTLRPGWRAPEAITLFSLADATLKLWGAKLGWSMQRLFSKDPHYSVGDQIQILTDLELSTKATTLFDGAFKIRSLSGEELHVALRDVGWNFGELSLGGLGLPEGVQLIFGDVVRLIIEEMGFVTENNGARYFSFSGGVEFQFWEADRSSSNNEDSDAPQLTRGGVLFHRLRFRTGGNPNAPGWLLDGVSLSLRLNRFSISGFGMVSEFTEDDHNYREIGFGVMVNFDAYAKNFLLGMQIYTGRVRGPDDNFSYSLFGLYVGSIPVSAFDVVNVRLLLVNNMAPNLSPPDGHGQNMRLFRWYKESGNGAVVLPNTRKLTAWTPKEHSLAVGIGLGLSLSATKAIVLDGFFFYHQNPEDKGFIAGFEVFMLKSPKAVGFGVFEMDLERDKWSIMVGVTMGLNNVLGPSLPSFLPDWMSLTGTLYCGNQPGTFAIGQLNDQTTWLSFRIDARAFIDTMGLVGLCVQIVEGDNGPKGFGLVVSAKGGANFGIGKIQLYAVLGLIVGVWRNESKACGFVIWIELGLRIKVFYVFNFGASAKVEYDYLDGNPPYRHLGCEVRINTPWWLPDVTFRFEKTWDNPIVELLEVVSTPLIDANAIPYGSPAEIAIALTPLLDTEIDEREVYTIDQLRVLEPPSLPPGTMENLIPVGVDSTIALSFKPAMNDRLSIGEITPEDAGAQSSGDLTVTYELVEIGIRRRPRFGPGAGVWTTLLAAEDTRAETPDDLSDISDLVAHFTSAVRLQWDRDQIHDDHLDPRRLLINATTPYSFITSNPEADEALVRHESGWPCCTLDYPTHQRQPQWHVLDFTEIPVGVRAPAQQKFSASDSALHWLTQRPPIVSNAISAPPGAQVARTTFMGGPDHLVTSIHFERPVAAIEIYVYWVQESSTGTLSIEAYHGLEQVKRQQFPIADGNAIVPISFGTSDAKGFTSMLIRYTGVVPPLPYQGLEFLRFRYRDLQDAFEALVDTLKCKANNDRVRTGGGKFAWLPNHDYEVTATTKVILDHTKSGSQNTGVPQQAVFRTKGLPGLNVVQRIGDELQPYVESHYPKPVPRRLYRKEPAVLAFNEKFNVLVSVDRIPSPDNPDELNQLLEWVLAVEKVGGALGGERISLTSPDWVVEHRSIPLEPPLRKPMVIDPSFFRPVIREARTLDPMQIRFEHLLHHSSSCGRPAPTLHRSQVLFHDPVDPGAPPDEPHYWTPNTEFRVNVRRKVGPFVERTPFDDHDYTAFDVANEDESTGSPWRSTDGAMRVMDPPSDSMRRYAVFGESNWNHIQILVLVDPEGGAAGLALGVAGLPGITQAILMMIDEGSQMLRLIERRDGIDTELNSKPLPEGLVAPYTLMAVAFDDQLRASVGETTIDVARGEVRDGRAALVAQRGGAFGSLIVEPLDAYRFHFQSSRFIDFESHIDSFDGDVDEIAVGDMLSEPVSETAAALYSDPNNDIDTVMLPASDVELRQRLFDKWTNGLAIPLRDHVEGLQLTRLTRDAATDLILLESPEPLPFSEDVTLVVKKRTLVIEPPGCLSALLGLAPFLRRRPTPQSRQGQDTSDADKIAEGIDFVGGKVSGYFVLDESGDLVARTRKLVRAVQVQDDIEYRLYGVRITRSRGAVRLSGSMTDVIYSTDLDIYPDRLLSDVLSEFRPGEIGLFDGAGKPTFPDRIPTKTLQYLDSPIRILTNGRETQALIIPVNAAGDSHVPLTAGRYRFEFSIKRARYRAESPDETSNYRAKSTVAIIW